MAELLTDEIIKQHLEDDGFMEEPDGPWILEYIAEEYGGNLDNEWSDQALNELTSGGGVWIDPNLWSDMEYDFNYELELWWADVYQELWVEKEQELLDTEEYYYEKD